MNLKNLEVSYIVPVYQEHIENTDLDELLTTYNKYDINILNKIHFIFVDDCSPIPVKINTNKLNYTLARITDDIKWNQGGARNLGVNLSKTSKLILTDLDHIFPEEILKDLIAKNITKIHNKIFKFRRKKGNTRTKSHANTFFCTKATFYKSLGVDEEFCGNYGFEDIYFVELQKFLNTKFKKYRKNHISVKDHVQHSLKRDTETNSKLFEIKIKAIKNKTPFNEHSRKALSFNWKIIDSNFLD